MHSCHDKAVLCRKFFCTCSITDTLSSFFIALFVSLKNTNLLLALTQTHSVARGTQCTVTHIPRKRRYDIIIIICSGLMGRLGRRAGGGRSGRRRGRKRGKRELKKKNVTAKYDDSCCIIAVPVNQAWSGFGHVFKTSSENNRCSGAIIPLMHALKTGQVEETNSSAAFYYLHMTKEP